MQIIKKIAPLALALSVSACLNLNLDGVEIGGLGSSTNGKLIKFYCKNGEKGSIKIRDNGAVSMAYSDGKSSYVTYMNNVPSASGTLYMNDKQTLKWHEKGGQVIFNYPDENYRQIETYCRIHS